MKKIGIIGAMELEVTALKDKMQLDATTTKAGMNFFEGTLNDISVVIVQSGIGKVNAGICVQILVDLFNVSHIINTGIAGSLNANLDIGDIVISKEVCYHDVDVSIFGYSLGQIPGQDTYFIADETLASTALATCKSVLPEVTCHMGNVVTGDQFISSKEVKEQIISNLKADCAEMEGGAIAHAATLNKVPFVIIRAISDKADDSAHMDYPEFELLAAKHSATLVENFIMKL